jgi:phenylacetate-CoA ligase
MKFKVVSKGVVNLIIKRYSGPFWIRRRWLNRTQWLRARELEKIQLKLLKRLVRHCYNTVPYYRWLMDERGISPESIKTLDDIKRFPILYKKDVLAAEKSIFSAKYPGWMMTTGLTGGTTGTPLSLPRNLFAVGNEHAFVRRQWDWAGIGFRDCTAYLSGRVVVNANRNDGQLYEYDPFMKELILSTYHLSRKNAGQFGEAMKRYRIKAIVGYTSSIYFLAKCCLDLGLKVKLKAVLPTSETINDLMHDTIAEAFECRVFDFYGAAERVCYIHTCDHGSYHLIPEYGYTEFVQAEDSNNNYRKVIATGFWNFAMPLIRYDTQDSVIISNEICSCGREFAVIKSVIGRTGDVIRTPSGREYGPTLMARVAKGANNILESQIIQDAIDHINILYVPNGKFTTTDMLNFRKHMAYNLPDELKMDFKRVSSVERTASGKMNLLISKIKS